MRSTSRLVVFLAVLTLGLADGRADVNAIVAKARSYLGSDATLDGIKSIRYVGTLATVEDGPDGQKPIDVRIEIIFQKPFRHRTVAAFPNRVETMALDNYDAWQRIQDSANEKRWELRVLGTDQIKRMRANTWENLSFYRGLDRRGGRIQDLGEVKINGVSCQKVAFRHDDQIIFHRYFDRATGRLVLTETDRGDSIREEGEINVAGVKFPKKIAMTNKLPNGKDLAVTVTFEKITVNETFADSLFSVPQPK